jgi:hypothetical protein
VSKVFTPRTVEELHPRVQQLVDGHLDAVAERGTGEMDLIADLAFPLPFVVISDMLGIPESRDRNQLREWSGAVVKTFDPILTREEQLAAFDAIDNIVAFTNEAIDWKRANPGDDLLTALIAAEDEGDRLSADELVEQVMLLYIAGHETTVNLIGNGLLALYRNPDQLALLKANPALITNAIEEFLRYDSSVQLTGRVALEDIEDLGGKRIPKGESVLCLLGSANHDPAVYPDHPERLDITRPNVRPLSFGGGIHFCLGAQLARIEAEIAISTLLRRLPDLRLDDAENPEWRPTFVLRGLKRLPASW